MMNRRCVCDTWHIKFLRRDRRAIKSFSISPSKEITSKMRNLIPTLIFINVLQAISSTDPITVQNSPTLTEEQAAQLFVEIGPKEVLPLVFFKTTDSFNESQSSVYQLRIPHDQATAQILNGRMIQGTRFLRSDSDNQMYLCPKQDSDEKCLVPQRFEENEPLQCATEPIPELRVEPERFNCGSLNNSVPFTVVYRICPSEGLANHNLATFAFCYNLSKRKTTHTIHYILNPLLLKSNLLFRERNVPYPFIENDALKILHFEGMDFVPNTPLNLLTHPEKPDYQIQKLVPDTDMPFALWRKTTYQNVNLDWQHKTLIPLWNKINDYIKSKAIELIEFKIKLQILTAVYDIVPASVDDNQLSNIWIKMIITSPANSRVIKRGIVILMNNFIDNAMEDDSSSTAHSNSINEAIAKFCNNEEDLCIGSLLDEFKQIGGRVRCCYTTKEIGDVFGIQDMKTNIPQIDIPGITSERGRIP